jgi:S1-C subfamily serine protease
VRALSPLPLLALLLAAAPALAAPPRAAADPAASLLAQKDRVAEATVTLPERSCAGAVAHDAEHVVTAAHCIPDGATRVRVRIGRATQRARVEHLDEEADLAWLRLDRPTTLRPLELARSLPARGTRVLFVGRTDRPSKTQVARIERLGRCPSLPGQPQALFTSVQARPGDSGAPLVDEQLRVVGVIHGGADCHIAAPTAPLAKLLGTPGTSPPADGEPPEDEAEGLVFERTPNGFRFRWSMRWVFGR